MDLRGKVALVTGGSKGIGREISLRLGERGAHVVVGHSQEDDSVRSAVSAIEGAGGSAVAVRADLSESDGVDHLLNGLDDLGVGIDVLVNNAGSIIRPADWQEITDDVLRRTVELNLTTPMRLVARLAPAMRDRGWGRIVNLTTTYAITGCAPILAYSTAKAGIISLTYAMARELGSAGVTVNAIAPGNIDTAMTRSAGTGAVDWAVGTTPVGRLGGPAEVAAAAVFLIDNEFVNGHVLTVDGGHLLNM